MKKKASRFLALLMSVLLLVSLLPTTVLADYADGDNCPSCGHYHWDDYMCASCGACSDSCTHSDCYEENHPCPDCDKCLLEFGEEYFCSTCGKCRECAKDDGEHCEACNNEGDICSTCNFCEDCIMELDFHCATCNDCYADVSFCDLDHAGSPPGHCTGETLACAQCGKCFYDAEDEYCEQCSKCLECAKGESHCLMCNGCLDGEVTLCEEMSSEADYSVCIDCCVSENWHCADCGEHVGFDKDLWCPVGGENTHCRACAEEVACPACGDCTECSGIDLCDSCGLCSSCCATRRIEEYGCECDDQCAETIGDHLCPDCGTAFCVAGEQCEFCGLCRTCCEENMCEHGVCIQDQDGMTDHSCSSCGNCFYEDELCPDCGLCLDCCHDASAAAGCSHEVCLESSEWSEHWCSDGDHCIEEYCDVCDGCKTCCDEARDGCTHDFTCPNAPDWDDHFCGACGDCFDPEEMCSDCGLCLDCCAQASKNAGCTHHICTGSAAWERHHCFQHNQCITKCSHTACAHARLSDWRADDSGHWRLCADCGASLYNFPKQVHKAGGWVVDTPATTTTAGTRHQTCYVCGHVLKTETIPPVGAHTCQSDGNYRYDGISHWTSCITCGQRLGRTAHSLSDHRCRVCNYCDIDAPEILDRSEDPVVRQTQSTDDVYMTLYVTAQGEGLTYQWYEEAVEEGDGGVRISGATNARLRIRVQDYFGSDLSRCVDEHGQPRSFVRFVCLVTNAAGSVAETIDVRFEHTSQYWQDMDTGAAHDPSKDIGHLLTCRDCLVTEGEPLPHRYNGTYKCADCGHVKPPVILAQPRDTSMTVANGATGKTGSMTFSVTARGDGLTYQWYYASFDEEGGTPVYYTNGDTRRASLAVEPGGDGCQTETYWQVYCVITDSAGNTVTTQTARGKVLHDYYPGYSVTLRNEDGTPRETIPFYNDTHHWRACIGDGHSFRFSDDWEGLNVFEKAEHTKMTVVVTAATTTSKAVVKEICTVCGWEGTPYESGDVLPTCTGTGGIEGVPSPDGKHDWMGYAPLLPKGATEFVVPDELKGLYKLDFHDIYPDGTSAQHAFECRYCGAHDMNSTTDPAGAHEFGDWYWAYDVEPTEEHGAIQVRQCGTCEMYGEARVVAPLKHVHSFSDAWASNATSHWHACTGKTCDFRTDVAAHTYGAWETIRPATDTETGIRRRACTVCGYAQTQDLGVGTYPVDVIGGKPSEISAAKGAIVTITADTVPGMGFTGWTVEKGDVTLQDKDSTATIFIMPGEPVVIRANFVVDTHACPFTDVAPGAWYFEDVVYTYEHKLIFGTSETTFSPNMTTSRAMIVAMLHRIEGEPAASAADFVDVAPGQWYTEAIAWAQANGIVSGYGDGRFGPNDPINREQLATIMYGYAVYKGYDVSATTDLEAFHDHGSISGYAVPYMSWAVATGLLSGIGNDLLSPRSTATRSQAAAILHRFCAAHGG